MTDPTRPPVSLSAGQTDRAAGVLLGMACGDALGAGYEYGTAPLPPAGEPCGMIGGGLGGFAPGEWTDDTSMAVVISQVAATGIDLRSGAALDQVTKGFVEWMADASDVGTQISHVLSSVRRNPTAERAARHAVEEFSRTGLTGNGSLMRTTPVALAHLDDPEAMTEAAHAVSALTHGDGEAGEACELWCKAIAHAVRHGTLDGLRLAVDDLTPDRAVVWSSRLDEAESVAPDRIRSNGWVVAALMAAWSAISRTTIPGDDPQAGTFAAQHLALALDAAVRAGHDTDTVAAIAGGLLGARWGASAVPLAWRRRIHGWPGLRGRDLVRLGLLTARAGHPDAAGWPVASVQDYQGYGDVDALADHPHDDGVLLGGVGRLRHLPAGVDAVVSLCRLGAEEVPAVGVTPTDHVEVWLADRVEPDRNPHLDFVLVQAADMVAELRDEGRRVLLHCVQAQSRTPTVAALYATRHLGVPLEESLAAVGRALPSAHPNPAFRAALQRVAGLPANRSLGPKA